MNSLGCSLILIYDSLSSQGVERLMKHESRSLDFDSPPSKHRRWFRDSPVRENKVFRESATWKVFREWKPLRSAWPHKLKTIASRLDRHRTLFCGCFIFFFARLRPKFLFLSSRRPQSLLHLRVFNTFFRCFRWKLGLEIVLNNAGLARSACEGGPSMMKCSACGSRAVDHRLHNQPYIDSASLFAFRTLPACRRFQFNRKRQRTTKCIIHKVKRREAHNTKDESIRWFSFVTAAEVFVFVQVDDGMRNA